MCNRYAREENIEQGVGGFTWASGFIAFGNFGDESFVVACGGFVLSHFYEFEIRLSFRFCLIVDWIIGDSEEI